MTREHCYVCHEDNCTHEHPKGSTSSECSENCHTEPEVRGEEWGEGYYTFQFSFLSRTGEEMFDRMQINDPVSFEQAFVMAKKHASEFGKHKIQWLLKNSFIRETRAAAYREGLTEALEIVDHVREVHEQQCWAGRDHADVAFKEIQSKITSLSETN